MCVYCGKIWHKKHLSTYFKSAHGGLKPNYVKDHEYPKNPFWESKYPVGEWLIAKSKEELAELTNPEPIF